MTKLAMNQNTYNKLLNKDKNTFYFIDNTLKDGEIKNCANYLLSDEVAAIRKKILESEAMQQSVSEIEKLYKNAGVAKIGNRKCTTCEYLDCQNYCFVSENNKCDKFSYQYPPFTAEKQIELIKWLGKSKNGFGAFNDGTEGLSCHCDFNWEWFRKDFYADDFDNALAGLINNLWQDISEEEHKQIKEILE